MGAGNKFRHTRKGPAEDIGDGIHYRSAWERNIRRILSYRANKLGIIAVSYESERLPLIGYKYRGNPLYLSDFRVSIRKDAIRDVVWLIEPKGMLKRGGRLAGLDLSSLKKRDDASRIKLTGVQEQHPEIAERMWVIGEREYRWLERRYAHLIPAWEQRTRSPRSTRPDSARQRKSTSGGQAA